jgi:uncharacterized peroxidase-related enzyme
MPQPPHVSKLPVAPAGSLEPRLEKYLRICQEKLGLIPNVLRAYSLRPLRLGNFISSYNEIMLGEDSGLSPLEREMIAVVVSSANRCYYCLVAHGQAVRELSGDPQLGEMLALNHRVAELPERHRAMLNFAERLTLNTEPATEAERQHLRIAGFSDADIFDISETAAFFNYSNRMAAALDMMPNPEYHGMHRG